MADPIRVQLSTFQQQRLAAFKAEAETFQQAINQRLSDTVTAILAGVMDTSTLGAWEVRLDGDAIVCTPPAEPQATKPQLVKDIGPDGVSESAASG